MRQLAFLISTHAAIGISRAFEDMAARASLARSAEPESGKRAADRGGRRDGDVGVAACIIGAVAAKEMGAGRHAMVAHLVR